jgi:hypothetical protein
MLQIYLSGKSKEKIEEDIEYLERDLSKIYKQIVRVNLDEDDVVNYYWRSVSPKGFYSEEVIKEIKTALASLSEDKVKWIREFTSGLAQAFETVEKVETSVHGYTIDLRYLNNMALSYPFIIKAYRVKTSQAQLHRLFRLLENVTFRYLLRGGRAEIEARLNPYLNAISNAADVDTAVNEIIVNIRQNAWWSYWNDEAMISYLSGYFYQNRVDNYVLWKYELYLCDENHPRPHKVEFGDLIHNENIEHIAPKTPTDGNPVANGYGVYDDKINESVGIVSGGWLNRIGNLVLISKHHNCSIGNDPFDKKLASYGTDNLLNQQKEIAEFLTDTNKPCWDSEAIEKRQNKIIATARVLWDVSKI